MQLKFIPTGMNTGLASDPILKSFFGAEFLGLRIFGDAEQDTGYVPNIQNRIGYHHFRWPGGDYIELKKDIDGNLTTDDAGYAFSLHNPNFVNPDWIRIDGKPREGITEMFRFAIKNDLSFSAVLPTARYVAVNWRAKLTHLGGL